MKQKKSRDMERVFSRETFEKSSLLNEIISIEYDKHKAIKFRSFLQEKQLKRSTNNYTWWLKKITQFKNIFFMDGGKLNPFPPSPPPPGHAPKL